MVWSLLAAFWNIYTHRPNTHLRVVEVRERVSEPVRPVLVAASIDLEGSRDLSEVSIIVSDWDVRGLPEDPTPFAREI